MLGFIRWLPQHINYKQTRIVVWFTVLALLFSFSILSFTPQFMVLLFRLGCSGIMIVFVVWMIVGWVRLRWKEYKDTVV